MSRFYKDLQKTTAAVLDRKHGVWQEPPGEITVSVKDYVLALPRRTLAGIGQDGPLESYRRLQQLVETCAVFPCDVLYSGARTLQRYFSFKA